MFMEKYLEEKTTTLNGRRVKVLVSKERISTEEFLKRIGPKLDRIIERMERKKSFAA